MFRTPIGSSLILSVLICLLDSLKPVPQPHARLAAASHRVLEASVVFAPPWNRWPPWRCAACCAASGPREAKMAKNLAWREFRIQLLAGSCSPWICFNICEEYLFFRVTIFTPQSRHVCRRRRRQEIYAPAGPGDGAGETDAAS